MSFAKKIAYAFNKIPNISFEEDKSSDSITVEFLMKELNLIKIYLNQ